MARSSAGYPHASGLIFRNLARDYPVITHGKGVFLYDQEGTAYFDALGGAFVASIGHGNERVARVIGDQLAKVAYTNGLQFVTEPALRLASQLSRYGEAIGVTCSTFLSSGSEAVEAAIKFARQIAVGRKQTKRSKIIARLPSYHGNTLYALSASGRPYYKTVFQPMLAEVLTITAPYRYRPETLKGYRSYEDELEDVIRSSDPESILALIIEPIVGSALGAETPPQDYLKNISKICREYGILVIADEVLCGAGRTGRFFASEHFGFRPDIVTLGKGISGGYAALSAVMAREELVAEMCEQTGSFQHAQTFMQAPSMTIAGVACLEEYEKHGLVAAAEIRGKELLQSLQTRLASHPHVGDVRGVGLLLAIELVADRNTRAPFARSMKTAERLADEAFRNEKMTVWASHHQIDSKEGDLLVFAPPLTITAAEVEDCAARFERLLAQGFSS